MLAAQMRRQIFRQTIQIKETRATPLSTKFVKVSGIAASLCAAKALSVQCAVLPILSVRDFCGE